MSEELSPAFPAIRPGQSLNRTETRVMTKVRKNRNLGACCNLDLSDIGATTVAMKCPSTPKSEQRFLHSHLPKCCKSFVLHCIRNCLHDSQVVNLHARFDEFDRVREVHREDSGCSAHERRL
jgi:hypothetical protein